MRTRVKAIAALATLILSFALVGVVSAHVRSGSEPKGDVNTPSDTSVDGITVDPGSDAGLGVSQEVDGSDEIEDETEDVNDTEQDDVEDETEDQDDEDQDDVEDETEDQDDEDVDGSASENRGSDDDDDSEDHESDHD